MNVYCVLLHLTTVFVICGCCWLFIGIWNNPGSLSVALAFRRKSSKVFSRHSSVFVHNFSLRNANSPDLPTKDQCELSWFANERHIISPTSAAIHHVQPCRLYHLYCSTIVHFFQPPSSGSQCQRRLWGRLFLSHPSSEPLVVWWSVGESVTDISSLYGGLSRILSE